MTTRSRSSVGFTAITLAFLAIGCNSGDSTTPSQNVGSISGTVIFSGTTGSPQAPSVSTVRNDCTAKIHLDESLLVDSESLGVKNAVIKIINMEDAAKPRERDFLRALQHRNCRFEPHVLIVAAGREFSILNWDGIFHNAHTTSSTNQPFDRGQPGSLKRVPITLENSETIEIACHAHEWSKAWVVVAEHRFYTITGERGEFRLDGVPPGSHELEIWHETLGTQKVKFSVQPGKETQVDFEYSRPAG